MEETIISLKQILEPLHFEYFMTDDWVIAFRTDSGMKFEYWKKKSKAAFSFKQGSKEYPLMVTTKTFQYPCENFQKLYLDPILRAQAALIKASAPDPTTTSNTA